MQRRSSAEEVNDPEASLPTAVDAAEAGGIKPSVYHFVARFPVYCIMMLCVVLPALAPNFSVLLSLPMRVADTYCKIRTRLGRAAGGMRARMTMGWYSIVMSISAGISDSARTHLHFSTNTPGM
jgi:hypothetical protein